MIAHEALHYLANVGLTLVVIHRVTRLDKGRQVLQGVAHLDREEDILGAGAWREGERILGPMIAGGHARPHGLDISTTIVIPGVVLVQEVTSIAGTLARDLVHVIGEVTGVAGTLAQDLVHVIGEGTGDRHQGTGDAATTHALVPGIATDRRHSLIAVVAG